ncbi:hypothetical protein SEPCBS119000_000411 [Sporothrix epigloea]|uniref:Methyltransferase domain-containing protein n=1 Tax=Sporothrix epigloea TaxID=1892477 RepID=A0ABP0D7W6_9PEZI
MADNAGFNHQPSSNFENETSAQYYNDDCKDQLILGRLIIQKRNIPKGARVLDIGCGPGNLTVEIADHVGPSGSVVGADLSEERIKIANKTYTDPALDTYRPNLTFRAGDAHNLAGFPDDHFDFVVANLVLHFLDLRKALAEINRVLKPGGGFAASTASGDHLFIPLEVKKEVQSRDYYRAHIDPSLGLFTFPTQKNLKGFLLDTGYQSIEFDLLDSAIVRKDPKALINFLDASWYETYIRCLPREIQPTAWDDFEKELEKLRTAKGIEAKIIWMNAYATKVDADH